MSEKEDLQVQISLAEEAAKQYAKQVDGAEEPEEKYSLETLEAHYLLEAATLREQLNAS